MEIYERLEAVMQSEGIDRQEFSRRTGISNSTLTQAKQGKKNSFRMENYEKILAAFPRLRRNWLIFGEGSMLLSGAGEPSEQSSLFDLSERTANVQEVVAVPEFSAAPEAKQPPAANQRTASQVVIAPPPRKVKRIILYYSDNTFEEFEGMG